MTSSQSQPTLNHLTLATLLSDPLTRLVMRSDNVTLAETVRLCAEARWAVMRRMDEEYGRDGHPSCSSCEQRRRSA